jgi:hypothetical protein
MNRSFVFDLATCPFLIIDVFGMRKLPLTAAENLLESTMRRTCSSAALAVLRTKTAAATSA